MIRRLFLFLGLVIVVSIGIMVFRTMQLGPVVFPKIAASDAPLDKDAAAQRLSGAIRFATVSGDDNSQAPDATLAGLDDFLAAQFPEVFAKIPHEILAKHSLLFMWEGSDPKAEPILLAAHQDVVPVEAGTESKWTHPPFSGEIADGYVWGRGSLDDKVAVLAILEAAKTLLAQNRKPLRTIYFAFGQDEEIGGNQGAASIATLLKTRGIKLSWVLDEGLTIVDGLVPGVKQPVALIGIAEKGYATFDLESTGPGGHSSIPVDANPLAAVARAVTRIGDQPFRSRLTPPARGLLEGVAPFAALPLRFALSNLWLTEPLVISQFEAAPPTRALLQTVVSPTLISSGTKDNVVPQRATASINVRILPGDTIGSVKDALTQLVNDPAVQFSVRDGALDPSSVSATDAPGYLRIAGALQAVVPDAVVAPGLMLGLTDSRHYLDLSADTYRFLPLWLKSEDLKRIHGTDERISVDNYEQIIRFYTTLMASS